jgi:hypothetical protein
LSSVFPNKELISNNVEIPILQQEKEEQPQKMIINNNENLEQVSLLNDNIVEPKIHSLIAPQNSNIYKRQLKINCMDITNIFIKK